MRTIGIYVYQDMTMLDVLGPQQLLGYVPDFDVDLALTLIGALAGPELAAGLQLMAEYDPQPPTPFGSQPRPRPNW